MDVFSSLLGGFGVALTPQNLLYAAIGVTLGTAIGVLPGIGPALTIALLLPITRKLDPTGAFTNAYTERVLGPVGRKILEANLDHPGRIVALEMLIRHIKAKPGVWWGTHREAAEYVKREVMK